VVVHSQPFRRAVDAYQISTIKKKNRPLTSQGGGVVEGKSTLTAALNGKRDLDLTTGNLR